MSQPIRAKEPKPVTCPACNGAGTVKDGERIYKCAECRGSGRVTNA